MNATQMFQQIGESVGSAALFVRCSVNPPTPKARRLFPWQRSRRDLAWVEATSPANTAMAPAANRTKAVVEKAEARAFPAVALEITHEGTRFVPCTDYRWVIEAFSAGVMLGGLVLGRLARGGKRKLSFNTFNTLSFEGTSVRQPEAPETDRAREFRGWLYRFRNRKPIYGQSS